jgi:hypothetical protein
LADHDRAGADYQDLLDVISAWHFSAVPNLSSYALEWPSQALCGLLS